MCRRRIEKKGRRGDVSYMGTVGETFKFGFIELIAVYFSFRGERKVPKERHQRAGRPLDTCFSYMGLFDNGDTRARLEKHLRGTGGDAFLSAPKLNPRWARLKVTITTASAAR